jgi:hypothetical protein
VSGNVEVSGYLKHAKVCFFTAPSGVKGTAITVTAAGGATGTMSSGCYVTAADGMFDVELPTGTPTGGVIVEATGGYYCVTPALAVVQSDDTCAQGGLAPLPADAVMHAYTDVSDASNNTDVTLSTLGEAVFATAQASQGGINQQSLAAALTQLENKLIGSTTGWAAFGALIASELQSGVDIAPDKEGHPTHSWASEIATLRVGNQIWGSVSGLPLVNRNLLVPLVLKDTVTGTLVEFEGSNLNSSATDCTANTSTCAGTTFVLGLAPGTSFNFLVQTQPSGYSCGLTTASGTVPAAFNGSTLLAVQCSPASQDVPQVLGAVSDVTLISFPLTVINQLPVGDNHTPLGGWDKACPYGGTQTRTGADANGDGTLQISEIDPVHSNTTCNPETHALSGTITGLSTGTQGPSGPNYYTAQTSDSITLSDANGHVVTASNTSCDPYLAIGGPGVGDACQSSLDDGDGNNASTSFTFGNIDKGSPYALTIVQQPADRFCVVNSAASSGTIASSDVTTLSITCNNDKTVSTIAHLTQSSSAFDQVAVAPSGTVYALAKVNTSDVGLSLVRINGATVTTLLTPAQIGAGYYGGSTGNGHEYATDLAVDPQGNVWITTLDATDDNFVGSIGEYTVAGAWDPNAIDDPGYGGYRQSGPNSIAIDNVGNKFVSDSFGNIYEWPAVGIKFTLTCAPYPTTTIYTHLGVSPSGVLYAIGQTGSNYSVYRVQTKVGSNSSDQNVISDGVTAQAITTYCGAGDPTKVAGVNYASGSHYVDGNHNQAIFGAPTAIDVDVDGNAYVTDGNLLRRVTPSGNVLSVAGGSVSSGGTDDSVDYAPTLTDLGIGSAANHVNGTSRLAKPMGVAVAPNGTIYVGDAHGGTGVTYGKLRAIYNTAAAIAASAAQANFNSVTAFRNDSTASFLMNIYQGNWTADNPGLGAPPSDQTLVDLAFGVCQAVESCDTPTAAMQNLLRIIQSDDMWNTVIAAWPTVKASAGWGATNHIRSWHHGTCLSGYAPPCTSTSTVSGGVPQTAAQQAWQSVAGSATSLFQTANLLNAMLAELQPAKPSAVPPTPADPGYGTTLLTALKQLGDTSKPITTGLETVVLFLQAQAITTAQISAVQHNLMAIATNQLDLGQVEQNALNATQQSFQSSLISQMVSDIGGTQDELQFNWVKLQYDNNPANAPHAPGQPVMNLGNLFYLGVAPTSDMTSEMKSMLPQTTPWGAVNDTTTDAMRLLQAMGDAARLSGGQPLTEDAATKNAVLAAMGTGGAVLAAAGAVAAAAAFSAVTGTFAIGTATVGFSAAATLGLPSFAAGAASVGGFVLAAAGPAAIVVAAAMILYAGIAVVVDHDNFDKSLGLIQTDRNWFVSHNTTLLSLQGYRYYVPSITQDEYLVDCPGSPPGSKGCPANATPLDNFGSDPQKLFALANMVSP